MAREWLLRGVDPEELKPRPKDEGPKTVRSRWENFWYHHKVAFFLILFAVVLLVVLLVHTLTRNEPDYRVLLMTENAYTKEELSALTALLEMYGEDLDGDGEVEIQIQNCVLGKDVDTTQNSSYQQVQAHLVAGDILFFMWEPAVYEDYMEKLANVSDAGMDFLTTIPVDSEHLLEEGKVWSWKGDSRPIPELQERSPELYFTVRDTVGNVDEADELHQQSMTLLENFITDKKKD